MSRFNQSGNKLVIESVVPIAERDIKTIVTNLKLNIDEIEVENRHDPSLIAGIRVLYRGKVLDRSFKSLLDQLS